jgi:hypothetical protein
MPAAAWRRSLSYLETWDVITTANAVFGFTGWSRETVMLEQLHPPVLVSDEASPERGLVVCAYWAKTRVTVCGRPHRCARGLWCSSRVCQDCGRGDGECAEGRRKRLAETGADELRLAVWFGALRPRVTRSNGRRQPAEQAIDTGFAQRRQVASQKAIAARSSKLGGVIPV